MIVCFNHDEPGQYPVKLEQHEGPIASSPRFRVTYGKQVRDDLNYAAAAREVGYCLMHQAGCAGTLTITMTSFVQA